MSQNKPARATKTASVWAAEPVPIGESQFDVDSVREKIRAGQAVLRVVEYPWGVEFDVCDVEGDQ